MGQAGQEQGSCNTVQQVIEPCREKGKWMVGPGQDTAWRWGCPDNLALLTAQEWLQSSSGLPHTGASVISCVSSFMGLESNRQVGHHISEICVQPQLRQDLCAWQQQVQGQGGGPSITLARGSCPRVQSSGPC